ncbi:unnamed protein product [Pipistrellus nathusii]|uniref:Uncharacterized protein n=1 Tax=Pipistrellus nathusii TaxID=59473 RepID=A0ABN9ZI88_PIPNA
MKYQLGGGGGFSSPPWVAGTNEQNASPAEFTSVNLKEEFLKRRAGKAAHMPSHSHRGPVSWFHGAFGICGEIALPKLHVAPEVAHLSLVLLRCFQIWTMVICCCSIETVKTCHLKKNKSL